MPKIRLNSIELYYEEYGDGEEVIILLHGFLSSSKMWSNSCVPDLMKRYRVYAVDARGMVILTKLKPGVIYRRWLLIFIIL